MTTIRSDRSGLSDEELQALVGQHCTVTEERAGVTRRTPMVITAARRVPGGIEYELEHPLVVASRAELVAAFGPPVEGRVLLPTWSEITEHLDPLARSLARLHRPADWTGGRMPICPGCETAGPEPESPFWPCMTAEEVLDDQGIAVQTVDGRRLRAQELVRPDLPLEGGTA